MLPPKGSNSDSLGIMEVMVGEEKISSLTLSDSEWKNYSISLPNVVTNLTPANFRLNRYVCPKEEGESEDERKLGLAINRIGFIRT